MRDKNGWTPRGLVVEVQNGDVERALRKLKKKVQNEGIFQELKKRECYVKPSEQKRRERAQAISRMRKKARMDEQNTKLDKPDHNG